MGWLWSSGSAPKVTTQDAGGGGSSTTTENHSAPRAPEPAYSDPEIAKFMAQLQQEFGSNNNNNTAPKTQEPSSIPQPKPDPTPIPSSSQADSPSSSWWPSWGKSAAPPPPPPQPPTPSQTFRSTTAPSPEAGGPVERLDPVSESLLPTTMSCRQAFDAAFHCNSLGGQWTSVYRSGSVRACSEHWDDFWFCMRTRAYSGAAKEDAIRDFYRQKEIRRYHTPGRPASTDVWQARPELLPPGAAFHTPYEKPDIDDDEWRRREIERRRLLRAQEEEEEAAAAAAAAGRRMTASL
ncbi:hypothetical protein F4825DRAFT_423996 [Nemania diffusa]|nr:hypothetical protein F4825DRAFT_423996 [Nemania diffusa]